MMYYRPMLSPFKQFLYASIVNITSTSLRYKGHCYIFGTERGLWDAARQLCLDEGMDLVTVETDDENQWVKDTINSVPGM